MDGVVREVNVRMLGASFSLVNSDDREWKINQLLLVDSGGFRGKIVSIGRRIWSVARGVSST